MPVLSAFQNANKEISERSVLDNASHIMGEGEIISLAPMKTRGEGVAAQSRLRNLREMKLASTTLLSVALLATAAEGFRFAHFPITIDTDFLIVGKPSTVTCNYVKKRVEKVREITWFAGYVTLNRGCAPLLLVFNTKLYSPQNSDTME